MRLTEELIQELRRLSDSHNEPVLADAAERLEMCDKSHSVILRLLKHTKEDLDEVQTEREKMLEDMRGICLLCKYFNVGSVCEFATANESDCSSWEWRGYK